jgi:tRNA(adenine34) deaminase
MDNASDVSAKKPGQSFWDIAFYEASAAGERGETPVGAVIVMDGKLVAAAGNRTLELKDPTAHAEVLAIRMACEKIGSERLPEADLYVTLEPCTLCAGAISFARIRRLYFAATDPKGGAIESGVRFFDARTCHHRPDFYGGFREAEAAKMLKDFFAQKR